MTKIGSLRIGAVPPLALCALFASAICPSALSSDPPHRPEISMVSEATDQGGTLIVFGENLASDATVWLWQPVVDGRSIHKSQDELNSLKAIAKDLPSLPAMPKEPHPRAVRARVLADTGDPQVLMVQQTGTSSDGSPAWSENPVPTILWVQTDAGTSEPFRVNAPRLWFSADRQLMPGERARVFGMNLLGHEHNPPARLIAMKNRQTQEPYWAQPLLRYWQTHANVKQHELNFRVPHDVPAGEYQVWLHNLSGGIHGWSNPLSIEIAAQRDLIRQMGRIDESSNATPAVTLPRPRVFRVEDAAADGLTSDCKPIHAAIAEAQQANGGIVLIPPGTYAIDDTVNVAPGVVLAGSGQTSTILSVSPLSPFAHTRRAKQLKPMLRLNDRSGLQDLSVIAGPGVDINVLVQAADVARDVFIKRVTVENTHAFLRDPAAAAWENPDFGIYVNSSSSNFVLHRSRIVAPQTLQMEGYGRRHRHAKIIGNYFETFPHNYHDNVFLRAISDSVFENNVMAYGHRAFTSQGGMWRNCIAENKAIGTRGVANGSEVFMSEYGKALYTGPGLGKHDTLALPDIPAALLTRLSEIRANEYLYAFVMSGRGFGQYRTITANEDNTLKLAERWHVDPDETSQVAVLTATSHNLILNNSVSQGRGVYTFVYGSAIDNVMAGNEADEGGVTSVWLNAVVHEDNHGEFALLAHNYLYNHRLVRSGGIHLAGLTWTPKYTGNPLIIGNRLVRNQVWNPGEFGSPNQTHAYWNWIAGPNAGHGWSNPAEHSALNIWNGSFNVVENNYIDGAQVGVAILDGSARGRAGSRNPNKANVVRWNRIDRTDEPIKDHGERTFVELPAYQRPSPTR